MRDRQIAANEKPVRSPTSAAASGAWRPQVLLLIGSGVVASAQIGKAVISVPLICSDLALGVGVAGLIVAIFATMGATAGIGAGVVVGWVFGGR